MLSFLRFRRGKRDQKRRRSTTSWSPALESLEELILLSPTPGRILPPTRDITPPIVNLVIPPNRSTVYTNPTSSTLTLTANASDTQSGIASVQFLVDGRSIARTTTAPYSISWNTKYISGLHRLTVVARDRAGNVRTSAPVVVKFVLDKTPPSMTLNPHAKTDALQGGLTAAQKHRAEQLISLFENGTINFQYGYAERLGDGRGITFGCAGFTTGTGDGFEVVKEYTARRPHNPLARYLRRLAQLAAQAPTGDVRGLQGFEQAVARAARDPIFRKVQDNVMNQLYYAPSVAYSDELGLKTPLARAVLYDTVVMHGDGDDPDGTAALLARTQEAVGGTPASGVDEASWLSAFLQTRKADLLNAFDPATRQAWAEAAGRVDVFEALAASGNYDLRGPIVVDTAGYQGVIP